MRRRCRRASPPEAPAARSGGTCGLAACGNDDIPLCLFTTGPAGDAESASGRPCGLRRRGPRAQRRPPGSNPLIQTPAGDGVLGRLERRIGAKCAVILRICRCIASVSWQCSAIIVLALPILIFSSGLKGTGVVAASDDDCTRHPSMSTVATAHTNKCTEHALRMPSTGTRDGSLSFSRVPRSGVRSHSTSGLRPLLVTHVFAHRDVARLERRDQSRRFCGDRLEPEWRLRLTTSLTNVELIWMCTPCQGLASRCASVPHSHRSKMSASPKHPLRSTLAIHVTLHLHMLSIP